MSPKEQTHRNIILSASILCIFI